MLEERIFWEEIEERKILIINFQNLSSEEILQLIDLSIKYYEVNNLHHIYSLTDLTDLMINAQIYKKFKEMDEKTGIKDVKSALIGLNRANKLFLNLINHLNKNDVRGFYTKEEAIEWLVK